MLTIEQTNIAKMNPIFNRISYFYISKEGPVIKKPSYSGYQIFCRKEILPDHIFPIAHLTTGLFSRRVFVLRTLDLSSYMEYIKSIGSLQFFLIFCLLSIKSQKM
jgi:hypothetical protein